MLGLLSAALTAVGAAFSVPTVVFGAECLLGALPRKRREPPRRPGGVAAVVLIPAHDEARGIAATVARVRETLRASDRVLVVADNCGDDTAVIARAAGAEVVERQDAERRGKGYALAFGFEQLSASAAPPDVVIILDADCAITPGGVDSLVAESLELGSPVQADNTVVVARTAPATSRISAFAFRVRNRLRPRGLSRLGLPCHLAGTGMALPRVVLERAPHMGGHLAEDLAMGIELGLLGYPARYSDGAAVTSELAPSEEAKQRQRQRWEHGHLSTQRAYIPRLLQAAVLRRDPRLVAMALDLSVPPLTLHVALLGAGVVVGAGAWALGGAMAPMVVFGSQLSVVGLGVLAGWLAVGTDLLSPADLLAVPVYMGRKIPSYFAWLSGRALGTWVRAERTADQGPER